MQVSGTRSEKNKKQISLPLHLSFLSIAKVLHCKILHKDADTGHVVFRKRFPKGYPCLSEPKVLRSGVPSKILGDVDRQKGCWRSLNSGWSGRSGGHGRQVWSPFHSWTDKNGRERLAHGLSRIGRQGGFIY